MKILICLTMGLIALVPELASSADQTNSPATIILPASLVSTIVQHLVLEPFKDVAPMMTALKACLALQTPNADGKVGDCPEVGAALAEKRRGAGSAGAGAPEAGEPEHK